VGGLSSGWTEVKEEVEEVFEDEADDEESPGWMRPGKARGGEDDADMSGYMLPEERGGERTWPAGVAWDDDEAEHEESSSGKGYSNLVESLVAKGVPTMWFDGEWRVSWSRFMSLGMLAWGMRWRIDLDLSSVMVSVWSACGSLSQ